MKNEYEKKIKELEIRIQKTQKTHMEVCRKQTAENSLERKLVCYIRVLWNLKKILPLNLKNEYEKKIKELEISIQKTHETHI